MVGGAELAQSHADDYLKNEEMSTSDEATKQENDETAEYTSNHMKQEDKATNTVLHDLLLGDDQIELLSWLEARFVSEPVPQGVTQDTHKINMLVSIAGELRFHMEDSAKQAEHQRIEREQLKCEKEESVAALYVQMKDTEKSRLQKIEAEKKWRAEKLRKTQMEEDADKILKRLRQTEAQCEAVAKEQVSWEHKLNAVEKQIKLAEVMRQIIESDTDSERREATKEYGKIAGDGASSNLTDRYVRPSDAPPKATKSTEPTKKAYTYKPSEFKEETPDSEADDYSTKSKSTSRPSYPKRTVRSLNSDDEACPQPASKKPKTKHDQYRDHSASSRSFSSSSTHRTTPATESASDDEVVEVKLSDEEGDVDEVKPCAKHVDGDSCACEDCWDRSGIRSRRR
ncbi:hypothetical protein CCP1ISM_780002 [Azospirillaceae bacterium]